MRLYPDWQRLLVILGHIGISIKEVRDYNIVSNSSNFVGELPLKQT